MLIALTLGLIVLTVAGLILLRIFRPEFGFAWPIAATGVFLALISTLVWQFYLPISLEVVNYSIKGIFNYTIVLSVDSVNYPYGLGVLGLVTAAILISTANAGSVEPLVWVNFLFFALFGLWAVLAGNFLTLVIAWAFVDFSILIASLSAAETPVLSENAVWAFSARVVGSGLVLWAGVLGSSAGLGVALTSIPSNVGLILLVGVLIRLAALLLHLPYTRNAALVTPYDVTVILVSAAVSLVLLSRLNFATGSSALLSLICIFAGIIGIASILRWLRQPGDITNRPFWMLSLAMLSVSAAVFGNPIGSVAWGSAILFIGGIHFFYSNRKKWLTVVLFAAAFALSSLPYSLTATAWDYHLPAAWITLIFLIPLQSLVIAGFIRSIALGAGNSLDTHPNWVKVFYPMGLLILLVASFLLGVVGWQGAGQIGNWIPSLVTVLLSAILTIILLRIPWTVASATAEAAPPPAWAGSLAGLWWTVYRAARRLIELFSSTFEGDGGFLWTILLLVLFVSILGGFLR
jgi:hypothetical protein